MFNKERIENLEKRVKEQERKEGISKLSEDVSKRLIHALIDSNNEVVKRVFGDVGVRSVYGTSAFQPPKAGDIHASNAVFNGIPDSLKKIEEGKMEVPTIASVLEEAGRNTIAIQELLKRTSCSNVNEVISKFELGVSFKKMYDKEARKRKELAIQRDRLESEMMRQIEELKSRRNELLAATGCANFSDLKNKFLCKDIKRDELIGEINELSRQRELLDRDLRNQIAKLSDKNQSLMQSEKSLICKLADKNEELKRVEEISEGRYEENAWLRGEMKKIERTVERLKKENKQLKSVNAKRVESTLDSICREADAIVRYSDLKKKYDKLLSRNKELQAEVLEVLRDKKYLEMANTSFLQETRKIRESLNEKIKKLRQRLKKSSIRYRDLKESISRNGLKSV